MDDRVTKQEWRQRDRALMHAEGLIAEARAACINEDPTYAPWAIDRIQLALRILVEVQEKLSRLAG